MTDRMISLRLSARALARLDARAEGRSAALRELFETVARGDIPADAAPRKLLQISAQADVVLIEQARAMAAAHEPPLTLPEAVEALLLANDVG